MQKVFVYDPTFSDKKSAVRGVGRYLQILKENFSEWNFTSEISNIKYQISNIVFLNPFFNFFQPPVTLKRLAKKQIAVIHDLIPLKYPNKFPAGIRGKLNIFLNKLALKNYDLIITDSLASKNDIIKILKIPEKKIKVIYPCLPKIFLEKSQITNHKSQINPKSQTLNSKQYQNSNNQSSKQKNFENFDLFDAWNLELGAFCLYVGDATWNKNLVNLAKAIKIINVTCIFVGKVFTNHQPPITNHYNHPWQKELKQFIEETKNDKRFVFLGYVKDEDLINLYKNANLNILPSRDEGFGFSYLEAASQGCPTLLSDIPVFHEISNKNSFFNPEDPYDIANKIGEVYFNPSLRQKLGIIDKKRSKFFSREKFKKEFKKILAL